MDLLMPEMNGEEFLAALREDAQLAAIPVVMITGARTDLPDAELLRKPFELSDLIATVARHCGHRRTGLARAEEEPAPSRPMF